MKRKGEVARNVSTRNSLMKAGNISRHEFQTFYLSLEKATTLVADNLQRD